MTTTNDWIKMSERKPTEADLPVWFWRDEWGRNATPLLTNILSEALKHDCWCKADIPGPPKEPTQRERDEAAFTKYCNDTRPAQHFVACLPSWHAALAWERAEIAKILGDISPMTWLGNPSYFVPKENMERLHARLRP